MAMQRTFVIVKPDAVQRKLVGRIIARFEDKGLTLVGMKLVHMTPELAARQYAEHQGKPFYTPLVKYMTSAPCVAVVLEGVDAVAVVRRVLGSTNAREAAPGTIRGDFGMSLGYNIVHGSDGVARASEEIAIFFGDNELVSFPPALRPWINNAEDLRG